MGVDGVFEWVINDPKDIRPYGVLVRDKAGCDHRTLGELIADGAWNKNHKPLPFGSFDYVPGKVANPDELERSFKHAKQHLGPPTGPEPKVPCAPTQPGDEGTG